MLLSLLQKHITVDGFLYKFSAINFVSTAKYSHSIFQIITKYAAVQSSSSRMRVIYNNWSATKQHPHPQSVAEISRHSVLSGDRIRQCETSSGSRHKDTDQCL